MKTRALRGKLISVSVLAILLAVSGPIELQESARGIEETQEVKLFVPISNHLNQYPKKSSFLVFSPVLHTYHQAFRKEIDLKNPPKYILYHNLIFYQ